MTDAISPLDLADAILAGHALTDDEALAILRWPDERIHELVAGAARLRYAHFSNTVKLNYLVNLKSGLCQEDCGYCSQSIGSGAGVLKYSWLSADETVRQAQAGIDGGAHRVCLVASGRGPSNRDVDRVGTMVKGIKDANPDVEICACLGLLKEGQAEALHEAGVDAYNHNLNTSRAKYGSICSTHTYDDRADTIEKAHDAKLSACSGLIAGLGEDDEDLVSTVDDLIALGADSIPVNFLIPFEGTPMAQHWQLTANRCLRILAMIRYKAPDVEVRIGGGREMHLRHHQLTALQIANSIFLGDYLTSQGQSARADLEMLRDGAFTLLGQEHTDWDAMIAEHESLVAEQIANASERDSHQSGCGGHGHAHLEQTAVDEQPELVGAAAGSPRPEVKIRQRGAGTDLAPNA